MGGEQTSGGDAAKGPNMDEVADSAEEERWRAETIRGDAADVGVRGLVGGDDARPTAIDAREGNTRD